MQDNFKWTDELACDFFRFMCQTHEMSNKSYLQRFKESKQQSVNKGYEILSYVNEDEDSSTFIFSVKRLSDNEIFCLGELTAAGSKIHSFEERKNYLLVNMGEFKVPLEYIVKRNKEPQQSENKDWEIVERFTYGEVACDGDLSPIKSVRRLLDNEVFTVGDKVYNEKITCPYTISAIFSEGNSLMFSFEEHNTKYNFLYFTKNNSKQPLFTTEDNVPIYDDNSGEYFGKYKLVPFVNTELWLVGGCHLCNVDCENSKFKYFSTEQAAKEYIKLNSPKLSLNDVLSCCHNDSAGGGIHYIYIDKLIEFVKQRII